MMHMIQSLGSGPHASAPGWLEEHCPPSNPHVHVRPAGFQFEPPTEFHDHSSPPVSPNAGTSFDALLRKYRTSLVGPLILGRNVVVRKQHTRLLGKCSDKRSRTEEKTQERSRCRLAETRVGYTWGYLTHRPRGYLSKYDSHPRLQTSPL